MKKSLPNGWLLALLTLVFSLAWYGCDKTQNEMPSINTEPLFINSIVSTDIDFIQSGDSDAFENIEFLGRQDKEMPDSRSDVLFDEQTFIFRANFSDNTQVEIWAHSSFNIQDLAETYAKKLGPRIGKLPHFMRAELSHVVMHNGDAGAFAEADGRFFIIYSDNMDNRISNNDLEETVFHESVHATLDNAHLNQSAWKTAQERDNTFITEYAERFPDKEDLAESAIFVYTILKYPGRLSDDVETWVNSKIPHRVEYIKGVFE